MYKDINQLFNALWLDYIKLTPSALTIHQLLGGSNKIVNDHIALRTFNLPEVNLQVLARHFEHLGYRACENYEFKQKKLMATHFEHADPLLPKVFISELLIDSLSEQSQQIITNLIQQMDKGAVTDDQFLCSGRHWPLTYDTYQALLAESEYAAWVAAFGYRVNHFTVSINHLSHIDSVKKINALLKDNGFRLNSAGGEIKGSPDVLLEQSSIMADKVAVHFDDKVMTIPSCFYEFALRYPKPDGNLYTGFVAASADKIFESTNVDRT